MRIPSLKNSKLEDPNSPGAEAQLAPKRAKFPDCKPARNMNLVRGENNEQRNAAADAEATQAALARTNDAIGAINSLSELQSHLPPAANLVLRQGDSSNGLQLRSSLDPEIVPELLRPTRPPSVGPSLAYLALVSGLAAIVAFAIMTFPSFQSGRLKGTKDNVAPVTSTSHEAANEPPQSPLVTAEDQPAFANEPVAPGVSVAPGVPVAKDNVAPVTSTSHEAANEPPQSPLVTAEDQPAFANEPVALGSFRCPRRTCRQG